MAFVNSRENRYINISNTHFIFQPNLGGDPARDRFARPGQPVRRRANLVIPDPDQARALIDMGVNVKQTEPREGEEENFVPTYYVAVLANFDSMYPPKIMLVSNGHISEPLDANSVREVDHCYVLNIDAVLNPYHNPNTGRTSLYIRTMYVTQDVQDDPYAAKYQRMAAEQERLECEGMDTFA